MGCARSVISDDVVLMDNINCGEPMCIGTPEDVRRQVQSIIQATKGRGIILSSGYTLGANTKPENMEALIQAAREFGTEERLKTM